MELIFLIVMFGMLGVCLALVVIYWSRYISREIKELFRKNKR
jgi:ABC-type transporter Mla subunit MlaD